MWQDVECDPALANDIIVACKAFVDRVRDGDPPMVDGSVATTDALAALYPEEVEGASVELDQDAVEWDERIAEIVAERKALNAEERELKNRIKAAVDGRIGIKAAPVKIDPGNNRGKKVGQPGR